MLQFPPLPLIIVVVTIVAASLRVSNGFIVHSSTGTAMKRIVHSSYNNMDLLAVAVVVVKDVDQSKKKNINRYHCRAFLPTIRSTKYLCSSKNNNNDNDDSASASSNNNNDGNDEDWDGIGDTQFNTDTRNIIRNNNPDMDNVDEEAFRQTMNVVDTTTTTTDNSKSTGSSSLFSQSSSSSLSSSLSTPSQRDSRSRSGSGFVVDERELQLVSVFERTLPLQAVALIAILCFTIYIGVSGGITDGSDRYDGSSSSSSNDNDVDNTVLLIEPEISDYLQRQQQEKDSYVGTSVFL